MSRPYFLSLCVTTYFCDAFLLGIYASINWVERTLGGDGVFFQWAESGIYEKS